MSFPDPETTLLDLLAGWLEYVEGAHELAQAPREEFEAEYFEEGEAPDPAVFERWQEHYDEGYLRGLERLNELAAELLGSEDGEPPVLTPNEFLREHLLPLFALPGEREAERPPDAGRRGRR